MSDEAAIAIVVMALTFLVLWVWFLALAGEPQSLWLLRDILGLMS
jgi:hypothetical protein